MIDEVQDILKSRGISGDRIRIEKFFQAR